MPFYERCYSCSNSVVENNFCYTCDYCHTCCSCASVRFFKHSPIFHSAEKNQHKFNLTNRFIAAEIEVAKLGKKMFAKDVNDVVNKWKGSIVEDGSLPATGFEINTAPASGDLFVRQIVQICDRLAKAEANITTACGLHVHLDARDFNYYDIRRLVKVYSAIEPSLFAMVPAYRAQSRYCIPCGEKYNRSIGASDTRHIAVKSAVVRGVYQEPTTQYSNRKYNDARYYALNLHSWFYRGTIECRLFDGTVNAKDIIDWGVLWANILDFALHSSDKQIDSMAYKDNKSSESLMLIANRHKGLREFVSGRIIQNLPRGKV